MRSEPDPTNAVFKALADPTRRLLLDRLRERNGQTLRELCEQLDMARQSATQHLDLLVRAGLVNVVRRGRERLHYLDPTPIHQIDQRWISEFDAPRLRTISVIKHRAEEHAMTTESIPDYVYVTYIHADPDQVWKALTDADLTAQYWGHANVSDWQPGSTWEHRRVDGSGKVDVTGRVLEAEPPTKLVITFEDSPDSDREPSRVTFLVEPHEDIVRLTVTHDRLPNAEMLGGISKGWPAVLANLKSLLETGKALPQAPWDVPEHNA
ncbi:ArsR/SmtB family transcription factor [Glycomyces xiaoerkulensis]|uniref:ArsR/SmtB family transcription factor n=1 Tax=Glycomyces xiaoerkulensis TaxID=2038139 RepID=UPI0018E48B7E|nr:metalloregulator ArsR/SmtB family transcription factor [Glycomyces xiaoerkulensis]